MSDPNGASYGKPRLPIKRRYILKVLELIVEGAIRLQEKNIITADTFENHITYHLCSEMDEIQRAGKSDFIQHLPLIILSVPIHIPTIVLIYNTAQLHQ